MKFQVQFRSIQANNAGVVEVIVPKEDVYVIGETVTLSPMNGTEYLQIKDGKGAVVFMCNAAAVNFCKAIEPTAVTTIKRLNRREDPQDE